MGGLNVNPGAGAGNSGNNSHYSGRNVSEYHPLIWDQDEFPALGDGTNVPRKGPQGES